MINSYRAPRLLLLFGPLAAVMFFVGIVGLAQFVPGYSEVRQTVSEIGEVGSPMQAPFTVLLCAVGAALLIFAWGVADVSRRAGVSRAPVLLIAYMGLAVVALGMLSFPHPLHSIVGLTELVGYSAPAAVAVAWRRHPNGRSPDGRSIVIFSWIMFALVWVAVALNVPGIIRSGAVWHAMRPVYGLIQRSLFAPFFIWCAGAGWMLRRRTGTRRAG
jgi:hypothetical membrane protein